MPKIALKGAYAYKAGIKVDDAGNPDEWIETCDISEDDRSKIAHGNAKQLLKI